MAPRIPEKRIRPVESIDDRTKTLMLRLAAALDAYQNADKKAGEAAAVTALCMFADDFGIPYELLVPALSAVGEIYDSQTRVGNSTKIVEANLMGQASALMTALMEGEGRCSENEAAKAIERATKGAISDGRVMTYRKRIKARTAPKDARDIYDHLLKETRRNIKNLADPKRGRAFILSTAARLLVVGKKV